MNCKNCDNQLAKDAKFCNKCGKQVKKNVEIDPEKLKKKLISTGNTVSVLGYFTGIVNIGIYLWYLLDPDFSSSGLPMTSLSSVILVVIMSIVFIILGQRLKNYHDRKTKSYLQVLIIISLLMATYSIATGGRIGILFIVMICYLFSSLFLIRKALKSSEFQEKITDTQYKFGRKSWYAFAIISSTIFFLAFVNDYSDLIVNTDSTKANSVKTQVITPSASLDKISSEPLEKKWQEFNSTAGQFKVLFPTQPTHETESDVIPGTELTYTMDTYTSEEENGSAYIVSSILYSDDLDSANPNDVLEGALNGMVTSDENNVLVSSEFEYFLGNLAINFLIQNEQVYMRGKTILKGRRLYQALFAYESQNYSDLDYENFINSFSF